MGLSLGPYHKYKSKVGKNMVKRISLKDIAEELNITANTVSRALKDKDDISQKTKDEVRRVAKELGYIPDMVASSMRTSSTKTVAVLFDNLMNPYFSIMANYLHFHLSQKGYRLMIFNSNTDAILNMDVLKQMMSHRVDGVITFLRPDEETAKFVNKINLPVTVIGREADDLGIDSIFSDDVSGGYKMGNYLFNKGYKNIGYIGAPENIKCSIKRAQGLKDYYNEKDIEPMILFSTYDGNSIYQIIDELISSNVKAIFCFNDSIAFSTMLYIKEKYPKHKDIEVTGYDNIASHLNLPISITTIGTDVNKMVELCVNQLMNKIDNFDIPLYMEVLPTFLKE